MKKRFEITDGQVARHRKNRSLFFDDCTHTGRAISIAEKAALIVRDMLKKQYGEAGAKLNCTTIRIFKIEPNLGVLEVEIELAGEHK